MADQEPADEGQAYPPDDDWADSSSDGTVNQPRAQQVRKRALGKGTVNYKQKKVSKNANRVLAMEKQRKALELRKGGASYASIATAVGYKDQSGARKAVQRAFRDVIQEPALEVKTMQIERLNHMLLTLWPKVQQGDERAIDSSLRVMDKIDRLMGTEAAQSVDVNIHQQNAILVVDGSQDDYINAMKRMVGINSDGTNKQIAPPSVQMPQQAQDANALSAVVAEHHQQHHPDAVQVVDGDVIDAEVVTEEPTVIPAPATARKFSFGMDPDVWSKEAGLNGSDAPGATDGPGGGA